STFLLFLLPLSPSSTLFPYTTLFRSGRSDCWTCCGWDSASRRPGPWARDESDLGSRSLPHVALLTLALFSRQPDPLLALLQRGGSGRLPLTLLRDKIGIGRGFFPGPAHPLLALAH